MLARILSLSVLFALSVPTGAFAQQAYKVSVRMIEGESVDTQAGKVSIDEKVSDIAVELRNLQFNRYNLLFSEEQRASVGKKSTLAFPNSHKLFFKPLSSHGDNINAWILWEDDTKMEVLNSQLHLTSGESMIIGMDRGGLKGLILSLMVVPVE